MIVRCHQGRVPGEEPITREQTGGSWDAPTSRLVFSPRRHGGSYCVLLHHFFFLLRSSFSDSPMALFPHCPIQQQQQPYTSLSPPSYPIYLLLSLSREGVPQPFATYNVFGHSSDRNETKSRLSLCTRHLSYSSDILSWRDMVNNSKRFDHPATGVE